MSKVILSWKDLSVGKKLRVNENGTEITGKINTVAEEYCSLLDDNLNVFIFTKDDFYGSLLVEDMDDVEEMPPVNYEYKSEESHDLGNRKYKHIQAGHQVVSQYVLVCGRREDYWYCRDCKVEVE